MTADTPTSDQISKLPDALEQFLDRIVGEKNFEVSSLPADFIADAKNDLRPLLQKSINLGLYTSLSEAEQKEFSDLADTNAPDETLQQFFTDHIPNQAERIAEIMIDFRNKYLGI